MVAVILWRQLATASIHRSAMALESKRRWLVLIRNSSLAILLLGLLFVWGSELKSLAFSVVAILAAVVLATKELITCFTGAMLKAGSNSFRIGDRIEVSNFRGEVIDHNLLTTTLQEIGPGHAIHQRTGRRTVFPNSLLLTSPVFNESFAHNYILHVFTVVIGKNEDWRLAESTLLNASNKACSEFVEEATAHFKELGQREGLDTSSAVPKITIQVKEADELTLTIRFGVPLNRRSLVEQEILRAFADEFFKPSTREVSQNGCGDSQDHAEARPL